jgi:HEAT repeat protein
MFRRRSNLFLAAAFAILLSPGNVKGADSSATRSQIEETIAKVRTGDTIEARTTAAIRLYNLTRGRRRASGVDAAAITEIVSLLDSSEEFVRGNVAATLGNVGPRAKVAVPKLLELLADEDCLASDISSAEAIRYALKRLGARLPPRCREIHVPPSIKSSP